MGGIWGVWVLFLGSLKENDEAMMEFMLVGWCFFFFLLLQCFVCQ